MAQKYLGDYFDIHCGGEDHIPVHHTNEIAQTEARVGTRLANFWMHGYFLLLNTAKMSKSAGDFLRLQLLIDRGYDPLAFRFLCLTAHYRSQMNFSWEAMDAAQTGLDRLRRHVYELGPAGRADPHWQARFLEAVDDDLQFPKAMALTSELLRAPLPDADKIQHGDRKAALALIAGGFYWRKHQSVQLTDKDQLILADFTNQTGDAVFDSTLKEALDSREDLNTFVQWLERNNGHNCRYTQAVIESLGLTRPARGRGLDLT